MGQIQVMSPALANQIAAGEVVERPASCVKELIENSLDAGAKKISVALEDGGITAIRVEDDGKGMSQEDAVLAFARHATSKLKNEYELTRIHTLGFRGEALASIAAVARVSLQTRTPENEHGWTVTAEGSDKTSEAEPIGRGQGTRVEVRDLFFNTPARLKYLRTVHTEQARCVEVVQRAALSRPDVAFRCQVENRVLFQTPGKNNVLDVLAVLYGVGEAKQFLRVDMQTPDYRVYGFVGRPTQGKSSRAHGNWFINGRAIRNIGLHQAVVAGYQGRLMINRQPIYALYLTMDPTLVDVNIHPHKSEVRFSEERDVTRLVQTAVAEALQQAFLVPQVSRSNPQASDAADGSGREQSTLQWQVAEASAHDAMRTRQHVGYPDGRKLRTTQSDGEQQSLELRHNGSPPSGPTSRSTKYEQSPPSATEIAAATQLYRAEDMAASHDTSADTSDGTVNRSATDTGATNTAATDTNGRDTRDILRELRPIGQTLGTYILAEANNTLFVIDQHAAHERVLYERFREQTEAAETRILPLLTPITVRLLPQQLVTLKENFEVLQSLGVTAEEFGGNEIIVRTIPQVWEGLDAAALVEDLLQQLDAVVGSANPREALRERIIMRACKSAIKANHYLSEMEIRALCETLPELHDPFHCPHGRPVFIRLTNHDLEREFRRIV